MKLTIEDQLQDAREVQEALDHFVVLAGWAIGEGYGSDDATEIAEAERCRKLLERALGVHSTIELVDCW